ncbi:LOW QUALITY PROTEIN: transcriptional activator hac1 [Gaeumannomyces tritici R3-111a-1]|uniref:Transcriptional activator hac1 n=1 Tax=Gaeumannomyces tritici (strain R3-111a-1) TaxID=644352 RepID=J3NUD6_GAET3|nr:LOW QUALITY PROTEIN: transcriptional activator hac1 [Gaeumannomyces tritici R3-111a-1]EJT79809.1 LOW QUALITY PROTEIN: transcriptional activator hac1 [Gaeumannomyces tritici R3-111a-1]
MDSWNATHGSPELKFENSPAESFLSTPSDMYPSLFGDSADATMDPSEMMSPSSLHEDPDQAELDLLSGIAADSSADPTTPAETGSEKKQTKKRKSWGQVLPEPKTNLPPRKRAKTEDEKEQRRVERVLRNRRAAQSSRERKRLEVEALEQRNKQLEQKLAQSQDIIMSLFEKIEKMRTDSGVVSRQTPVTLSQELFSSHDALSAVIPNVTSQERKQSLVDELLRSTQSQTTVNPASISPALSPVADEAPSPAPEQLDALKTATTSSASTSADNMAADVSPDLTQHPAEVLCSDLQCRSAEASRPSPSGGLLQQDPLDVVPGAGALVAAHAAADVNDSDLFGLPAALDADSYVLESGLLSSPNSSDFEHDYLVGDAAFPLASSTTGFDLFDINEYLNSNLSANPDESQQHFGAVGPSASNGNIIGFGVELNPLDDPEASPSPEDPNLQPQLGASSIGCDAVGLAVGAI